MNNKPPYRKLRGYAFDPSLSLHPETALINDITYQIPWEDAPDEYNKDGLKPGPIGEYLEVIDFDPTVNKFYKQVDLNHPYVLAQNGLDPSGSNPQFHQQMVYAVGMTTIKNFEKALGRRIFWSPHKIKKEENTEKTTTHEGTIEKTSNISLEYTPRLRMYPHAFRGANAYYDSQKKALLFGYFDAQPADITSQMPGNLTFTCLSHDIIAHETTHAILDGLQNRYTEDTNPDVLALHEAIADMVALFQHFTYPEVLKNQIAATRGNLSQQNLLGKLAMEYGIAVGNNSALRDYIGTYNKITNTWEPYLPKGDEYLTVTEPHARGSLLVSAVFEAFMTIYKNRITDLLRIASQGSGIIEAGELHPDLVNRLAIEASKASNHVLNMCIRALDYCPPLDINFGDFLRAIITADKEIVSDDDKDYRLAFINAFRRRGIYPSGIKQLSIESLAYPVLDIRNMKDFFKDLCEDLRIYRNTIMDLKSREDIFAETIKYISGQVANKTRTIEGLHGKLSGKFKDTIAFEKLSGLLFSKDSIVPGIRRSESNPDLPSFWVNSLHLAMRVGPDGSRSDQIIVTLTQKAHVKIIRNSNGGYKIVSDEKDNGFIFCGGCTLIFDLDTLDLKYSISKPILDIESLLGKGIHQINKDRCLGIYKYQNGETIDQNQFEKYFGPGRNYSFTDPFHFMHGYNQ